MENLFYQLVTKLLERGCISFANLFVDETKKVSAKKTWTIIRGVSMYIFSSFKLP